MENGLLVCSTLKSRKSIIKNGSGLDPLKRCTGFLRQEKKGEWHLRADGSRHGQIHPFPRDPMASGIKDAQRSAIAVIVRLGLTPTFTGRAEASRT